MEQSACGLPQEVPWCPGGTTEGQEWFLVSLHYVSGTEAGCVFLPDSSHLSSSERDSQRGLLVAMGVEA